MKAIIITNIPDDFKKSYADITIYEDEPPYGITKRIGYLKPLPQKKDFEWTDSFGIHNFKKGFNACLNEILGEEE